MAGEIKLTGFKELDRELQKLPAKLQKKIMGKAVRESSKIVLKAAKRNAPVRTKEWPGMVYKHPPGALRKFIKIRRAKRTKNIIRDRISTGKFSFWGHLVEFGHDLIRNKRKIGSVPAKPFMRPAFDANINNVVNKMKEVIKSGINNYRKG